MGWNKPKIILGLASGIASSSTGTSNAIFVGDARLLSLSVQTSSASASNITVSLSNNHGMNSADSALFFSRATVIPITGGGGIYTIDPGAQWIRVERPDFSINPAGSTASNITVILNRYYET